MSQLNVLTKKCNTVQVQNAIEIHMTTLFGMCTLQVLRIILLFNLMATFCI